MLYAADDMQRKAESARRYSAVRGANLVASYRLHTTRAAPADVELSNTINGRVTYV
jgi:hypothetical protein